MSTAFLVAAILAIGWNLTLAAAVLLTDTEPVQESTEQRTMRWTQMSVEAEVGHPAYDAQTATRPDGDEGASPIQAPSRVAGASRTVALDVRYADASVAVMTEEGCQLRHCSVCMN